MNVAYKQLEGKTHDDRTKEVPENYTCFTDPDIPNTEIWVDPQMFTCPVCRHESVDTGPWLSFMCINCGLKFNIDFTRDIIGNNVMLLKSN